VLAGACIPDLVIKSERLIGKVSSHVEQYPVIEPRSPQTARCLEAVCNIQLDVVISQDARAHVARGLVRIDEENFLAVENRSATKWWVVHIPPLRLENPLGER
jgi:hypothetical protein